MPQRTPTLVDTACDAFIVARVQQEGATRLVTVEMRGRVFRDGSWTVAFHDPRDPLVGAALDGGAGVAIDLAALWSAMAGIGAPIGAD